MLPVLPELPVEPVPLVLLPERLLVDPVLPEVDPVPDDERPLDPSAAAGTRSRCCRCRSSCDRSLLPSDSPVPNNDEKQATIHPDAVLDVVDAGQVVGQVLQRVLVPALLHVAFERDACPRARRS